MGGILYMADGKSIPSDIPAVHTDPETGQLHASIAEPEKQELEGKRKILLRYS